MACAIIIRVTYEFIVIGGGIAGASAAHALVPHGRTLLLERERLPGQHTTGRSAAFLVESYGNPIVQRLTRASRRFLENPPADFTPYPVLSPRPSIWIARDDQRARLRDQMRQAVAAGADLVELDAVSVRRLCPALREDYVALGMLEPRAQSIDVAGLLDGFLRGFRASGGELVTGAEVTALDADGEGWEVRCGVQRFHCGVVVNAAGAWADVVGGLAGAKSIGLAPLRRTAITFDPPPGVDIAPWPCVIDVDEEFYVKPEGARLLASPCDETPSAPCDAVPDDLAIALAAERVQRAMKLEIRTLSRSWAGLRSFVADRAPVIGMDPERRGFFWLAGQGGFGIMTSVAAARAAASLVVEHALPSDLRALGLRETDLAPGPTSSSSPPNWPACRSSTTSRWAPIWWSVRGRPSRSVSRSPSSSPT